jgi:2-polyprenyl-3-methyl-5-hydroxy-6-metoxy-1,4-benzoquinol methylase
MNVQRLLPLLRCLRCGSGVESFGLALRCRGCGASYPVIDDIPVLLERDGEEKVWEDYFDRLGGKKGDRENANSYFSRGNFRFIRKHLLRLAGEVRGLPVLDVGCGTGHFSQTLAKENSLVGVDISLAMAGCALKKGLAVAQSSGKKLPFAAGSFALVIANNVIQSFKDGRPFIRELVRVTKPGGRILLSATNGQNIILKVIRLGERKKYGRLGLHTADGLRQGLQAAGARVQTVLFLHYPIGKVKRIAGDRNFACIDMRLASTVAVEAVKNA